MEEKIEGLRRAIAKLEEKRNESTDRGVRMGYARSINLKKKQLAIGLALVQS